MKSIPWFYRLLALLFLAGCSSFQLETPAPYVPVSSITRTAPAALPTASPLPATPTAGDNLPVVLPAATSTVEASPTAAAQQPTETPRPQATAAGCTRAGEVRSFSIDSRTLGRPLTGRVYLPPCYDSARPGGYPVLYLLHGQSYDDTMWLNLGVDKAADRMIQAGEIRPLIMVMPREVYFLQDVSASSFGSAVLDTLLPWVDANFAVCSLRTCQAIGGISRGAYWALKIGLGHWPLFISAGGHSLPEGPYSYAKVKILLQAMPADQPTRLTIDSGNQDEYHDAAARYDALLTDAGYPHDWVVPSGGHTPAYWKAQVENYLRWYAAGWVVPEK
jgi:enterochelin esterase-like enzyme